MEEFVLSLHECQNGWRLFDDERALFWFPEYESAIKATREMAQVEADLRELPGRIEIRLLDEPQPFLVACFTPEPVPG